MDRIKIPHKKYKIPNTFFPLKNTKISKWFLLLKITKIKNLVLFGVILFF